MTSKLLLVGVSAVVVISIIVVLAFVQNQTDRAAAQKIADDYATKQFHEEMCDATSNYNYHSFSQGRDIWTRNVTKYYDCLRNAGTW
jgi:uncharacterized protein YxeA